MEHFPMHSVQDQLWSILVPVDADQPHETFIVDRCGLSVSFELKKMKDASIILLTVRAYEPKFGGTDKMWEVTERVPYNADLWRCEFNQSHLRMNDLNLLTFTIYEKIRRIWQRQSSKEK